MRRLDAKDRKDYIKLLKRNLKQIEVFAQLPANFVEKLANRAEVHLYQEDEIIITQFSESDEFYFILEGMVRAYDTSTDEPQPLNSLRRYDFFGERSLLFHQPRSANIQAVIDTYLACFDKQVWHLLEKEAPGVLAYFQEMEKKYELVVTKPFPASQKAIRYYSCFISYSSKDQEFAERLHDDLRQKGVRCYFAPEDMKIGDKIRATIEQAIRLQDKLLLIFSKNSINSAWVEKEVETAFEEEHKRNQIVLFPVRLDEAVMETEQAWAAEIRRTRYIGDFSLWQDQNMYQKAIERLLRDLKAEG
jgi:hypothetical protein